MKLNTKARYALRAMVEIHRATAAGRPVSLGRVSRQTRISRRYLEQLALCLRNADLLQGMRGRNGGYRLARPPEQIPIGEIVQAVVGPINIVECLADPALCLIADVCECRRVYGAINRGLVDAMNAFSLADLTNGWFARAAGEGEPDACGLGTVSPATAEGARVSPCSSL